MIKILYFFLFLELILISYIDIKKKIIPNFFPLFNVFLFILYTAFSPSFFSWQQLIYPLGMLVLGIVLFFFKIMGAGDSKLISSLLIFIPLGLQESFLLILAILSCLVGLFLLVMHFISRRVLFINAFFHRDISLAKGFFGEQFSYAPVILVAWIFWGQVDLEIFF